MKKIIFFICMFLGIVPLQIHAETIVECDGISFNVEYEGKNIIIYKMGENPFMKEYSYQDYSLRINNVYCSDDAYVFYGYAYGRDDINYYDSFLFVTDQDGNVLFEQVMDYGENEEMTGALWIDQVLFTITRIDDLGDRFNDIEPKFKHFVIRTYDSNYQFVDSIQVDNEIVKFDQSNGLLLLYYSYLGPVDLGLDISLNRYTNNQFLDVQESYIDTMKLLFVNRGYLNGEPVVNGLSIDYPGVYQFSYNGHDYRFVVDPNVEGVSNLQTYNDVVTPIISAGNVKLNEDVYISGTPIENPGNYTLTISGINGYIKTIKFTIAPQVEGVISGHNYEEPIVITFKGEGYLNNALVTSPLEIEDDGDYMLRINGVGGLSDLYEFSLYQPDTGISPKEIIQKIDIFVLVVAIVVGVVLIKKK